MNKSIFNIIGKLCTYGVVERKSVRNEMDIIISMIRRGYVKKIYKRGFVFYELSEKALPLIDSYRLYLKVLAKFGMHFDPRNRTTYKALLEDVRFLKTETKLSRKFLFLGDWQLTRETVFAQLLLSKHRYYIKKGLA